MQQPKPSQPSLAVLSFILRNPETWPVDFEWDYGGCLTCAIGLAKRQWTELFSGLPGLMIFQDKQTLTATLSAMFDIPQEVAFDIFFHAHKVLGLGINRHDLVTADHVAGLIDECLKAKADA